MQHTKTLRLLLSISGLIGVAIGASILLAPAQFHGTHGIELGADPNLLSEVRAPGRALLVLGSLMLAGVFVKSFTFASTLIAAAVYLAYGASRLLSMGLDGVPDAGLLGATAIELLIGSACAAALICGPSGCARRPQRAGCTGRKRAGGGVMLSPYEISALVAAVGSGLIAGLCFAFASFLMRSFDQLGAPQAIRAMQAVNATILRSSAMGAWFGTGVVGVLAAVLAKDRALVATAAGLYLVGAILVTGLGNVPLNDELAKVDPDAENAAGAWRRYRVLWGRWNAFRTLLMALSCAGFAWTL